MSDDIERWPMVDREADGWYGLLSRASNTEPAVKSEVPNRVYTSFMGGYGTDTTRLTPKIQIESISTSLNIAKFETDGVFGGYNICVSPIPGVGHAIHVTPEEAEMIRAALTEKDS